MSAEAVGLAVKGGPPLVGEIGRSPISFHPLSCLRLFCYSRVLVFVFARMHELTR